MKFCVILLDMKTAILVEAGLTEAQALTYTFLVENSPIAPPRLAELIKESRTNTYKLLESLEELGLAEKDESNIKIKYWAKNPSSLLQIVEEKKQIAELQAKKLESSLPSLVNDFLKHNEQPGVRFFQGKEGIKQIYEDIITSCKTTYIIRSPFDNKFLSDEFYEDYQRRRVEAGISTYISSSNKSSSINDKKYKKIRTFLPESSYNSPVEYNVYANKVAIISFDKEAIGMIIESPQIAKSMKQLFRLVSIGLRESLID